MRVLYRGGDRCEEARHGPNEGRLFFNWLLSGSPSTYSLTMKTSPSSSSTLKIETMPGCRNWAAVRTLAGKPLGYSRIVPCDRIGDLDRHEPIEFRIPRQIDGAASAATQHRHNRIAPDFGAQTGRFGCLSRGPGLIEGVGDLGRDVEGRTTLRTALRNMAIDAMTWPLQQEQTMIVIAAPF